jgi:2-(1,2-epoxy-1,2-dihydrophenyl)acetyl-CoA isomerase
MKKFEAVELEIDEPKNLAILYLNRPQQLNATNELLIDELLSAMKTIENYKKIRCLIITGKGRAFCAGGDLRSFMEAKEPSEFLYKLAYKFHKIIKILKNLNAPSIAAVNGACYGVGLSLASACDIRICSDQARFSVGFTSIGLSPDSSMTFHLPKIIGLALANEMALSNRILNAQEAKKYNLVSDVYPMDVFFDKVKELAEKIRTGPTLAFGSTKKLFLKSYSNNLEEHLEEELKNLKLTAGSEDFQEGPRAFFEKRKPIYKGK